MSAKQLPPCLHSWIVVDDDGDDDDDGRDDDYDDDDDDDDDDNGDDDDDDSDDRYFSMNWLKMGCHYVAGALNYDGHNY